MEMFLLSHQIRQTLNFRLAEEQIEDSEERSIVLRYVPIGVGVGIVPWNFPILLGIVRLVSALLAGNTLIWKPSPNSPYTALKLEELGAKIFPNVTKISFTSSVATRKKVMQVCAITLKRVNLELGGIDVAIVLLDADLSTAVPMIATMAYLLSGQVCFCIKRIYVHESIYDTFLAAFVNFVKTLKTGGSTDVEEQFGPIVPHLKWSDEEDVLRRANASLMGLGGSVWSKDAEQLTRRLEAGTVWINAHFDIGPQVEYGGHKNSGIGVESGMEGLKGWCNAQVVR